MPITQLVAPAIEPVTTSEVANYLRLDDDLTEDDTLTALLISAARRYAESYCGRSFITQQWRLTLDNWPGRLTPLGSWVLSTYSLPPHAMQLERGPVQSLDSIKYLDAGVLKTLDPSVYVADLTSPIARVTPVFGQIWPPISTPQIGNVQVNYTAGYGANATDVPEGIRQWILLRVATMYRNREEVAILSRGKVEILPYVDALLDPYKVVLA